MTYNPSQVIVVRFEEGNGKTLLCRVNGVIGFVHQNYSGILPRVGEMWNVVVAGETASKKNPGKMVYFVRPVGRVRHNGTVDQPTEYDGIIRQVITKKSQYEECLAALRSGRAEPTVAGLLEWRRGQTMVDAQKRNNAAKRAQMARNLLHQYGFKILREEVMASGEYRFTTMQGYAAFWIPLRDGEWLAVMTSPTRGYAISMDFAGWYSCVGATDPKPQPLNQNWNPVETMKSLATYEVGR